MNRKNITKGLVIAVMLFAPAVVFAETLSNPIGSNSETIQDVLITITRGLIGLVAVAATFMFIYGGVMMLTAGGNSEQVQKSKEVFKWSTISIILIFLTAALLRFLFDTLGSDQGANVPTSQIGLGAADLRTSVTNIARIVLGLLGLTGVVMLIYGGYIWLTAGGNEEHIKRATDIIRAAVIGLIIILLSWSIVAYVLITTANATSTT